MKKLMLSTAMLAATTFSAAAQSGAEGAFLTEADPQAIQASNLMGKRIYTTEGEISEEEMAGIQDNWNDVGEVSDIVLSRDGSVEAVVVDIGGFLGIGERQVAFDMDALRFVGDSETADVGSDYSLVVTATQADLENAPEFTMQDEATDQAQATMEEGAEQETAEAEQAAEGAEQEMAEAGAEAEQAVEGAEQEMAEAGAEAEQAVEGAEQEMAEAGAEAEQAVEGAEQEMAEAGAEAEQAVEGAEQEMAEAGAEAEQAVEATGDEMAEAGAEAEQVVEGEQDMAATDREPIIREGYTAAGPEFLTTENLTGARVYDTNDEWVGDVSELILTPEGQVSDAVVDVGGFLGIGEKPVALDMEQLDILLNEGGGDVRVYVPMSREELENMPEHQG